MLHQIGRLDGASLGGLDGKAGGGGGERGVVAAGERNGKWLVQTCHNGHIYGAAAQHVALERGTGGVNSALASNHAHAAASGMLRGTRHSMMSPTAASSAAMVVRNWSNSSS